MKNGHVNTKGTPAKLKFLYRKLCIYFNMFKLHSLSKYCPFDAIPLLRCFSHCSEQFLNSLILMLFSASAIFCFSSSTSAKHVPLRPFFIQGNKKEVAWGKIRWIWRVGHEGHTVFGQKLLNTQCGVGRCARKSPIMKWANTWKESSKNFTEAERSLSQQRQPVHWYRWVPRTFT